MTTLVHLSISKLRMKYQSIVGVLGNVQGVASPNYEVVESRRRIKKGKNNPFEPTEDPIPKLAGKPDTDLEAMLKDRGGTITFIKDTGEDEDEEDSY